MIRITACGLKRNLEKRVVLGDAKHPLMETIFDKDVDWFGILHEDNEGFYIQVLKRKTSAGPKIFEVTNKVYRVKDRNLIAIPAKDYLRFYEIDLSR